MFRRAFYLVKSMSQWERWILLLLLLLFFGSLFGILRRFYVDTTIFVPTTGGTYIEGSVGSLQPLNPWFTVQNDVNRDIVSLVFAGLLKYDPQTKNIEEDLATLATSEDRKVYTLTLKDNLFWHDSTPENLHRVTADDVLYTFKTIQDPQFPNKLLQQNFRGVTVEKVDDKTVKFMLEQPYNFFPSNLTLGLVPQTSFKDVPIGRLDQALDFGFNPVGAGPYKFKSVVQTDLSSEVTLERFPRPLEPTYRLDSIVFRIFADYSTLLSDLRTLQGVRLVPRNKKGESIIPRRFRARTYTLPQYVALFFNMQRPNLQDQKLRLGLQLGTNKLALGEAIYEKKMIDTPLLEIDVSDWRYQFDPAAAQGALFESNWNVPEKIRLQHLLEMEDANRLGPLKAKPVVFLATGAVLTLSGSTADIPLGSLINGVRVQGSPSASGAWIIALPTLGGTGSIRLGENVLRVTDEKRKILDTFYLYRSRDSDDHRRASEERSLVSQYVQSRSSTVPEAERLTPQSFFLERNFLRKRTKDDPVSVRRNERGEPLRLTILTSNSPPEYKIVAEKVRDQWRELGVEVTIEIPDTRGAFQERMLQRDYDVLLFGQSLLDNLDSYPYWHSSGVQKLTGDRNDLRSDAYNLSQYVSFRADTLLETIRRTTDEKMRADSLAQLRDLLKADVPAVFLYSPLYTFAHHQNIQGIELGALSLHSDRFLTLYRWFVKQERIFAEGKGWLSIFGWLPSVFKK
jgi:ABC-type transport system substrate-binding protein